MIMVVLYFVRQYENIGLLNLKQIFKLFLIKSLLSFVLIGENQLSIVY